MLFFVFCSSEHVGKGVTIIFEPELIVQLNVKLRHLRMRNWSRLTGIYNDVFFVHSFGSSFSYGPHSFLKLSQKPVVPTFETVVREFRIAFVPFIMNTFVGFRWEPSMLIVVCKVPCGLLCQQEFSIIIKNSFQGMVHSFVRKESSSILILHEFNKDSIDGKSD